jgi:predicted permease
VTGLLSDLRYAARIFRKNPGFALITTLLLALGIAANTVIFSAIDALLLRPLPVERPEELVRLVQIRHGLGQPSAFWAWSFYDAVQRSKIFASVLGQFDTNLAAADDGASAERIRAQLVSADYFSTLGVQALYGRVLTAEDQLDRSGAPPIVLSYPFWKRHYHGDSAAVGRTLLLQGHRCLIVGIMPRQFNGISAETGPDVRLPASALRIISVHPDLHIEDQLYYELAGRLHPGDTVPRAQAKCLSLLQAAITAGDFGGPVVLQPLAKGVSSLRNQFSNALIFLMSGAALLLLMVCANVAGLLLSRSAARRQEFAVRIAIGASSSRLFRQALTETSLLTFVGSAAGLLFAFASMPFLGNILPPIRHLDATSLTLNIRIEPDLRIAGFSLAICALTAMLFGIGPAMQAARGDSYSALKGARSSRPAGRYGLVVLQVALCTFLLAAASLLIRTLERLARMDPGFDADRVVTFSIDPTMRHYSAEQSRDLIDRLTERVQALAGVERAATASRGLMRGTGMKMTIVLPGQQPGPGDDLNTSTNSVSPGYFSTMGMHFVAGRDYTGAEPAGVSPAPRIVNEAFVRHFFPGLDPIGRVFGAKSNFQVVGVVNDAKYRSLREPVPPTMYGLWRPEGLDFILHVRTRVKPESLIAPVDEIMRGLDPELPIYEIKTLAEEVRTSLWSERLIAALASLFAGLAALLAAVGIYGLLSYAIAQRTREIGIRMALGARAANILSLISTRMMAMVVSGIAAGIGASLAASPWIGHLLYGVAPSDAGALSAAGIFVILVAAVAGAIPATRAIRVEPSVALRQEG